MKGFVFRIDENESSGDTVSAGWVVGTTWIQVLSDPQTVEAADLSGRMMHFSMTGNTFLVRMRCLSFGSFGRSSSCEMARGLLIRNDHFYIQTITSECGAPDAAQRPAPIWLYIVRKRSSSSATETTYLAGIRPPRSLHSLLMNYPLYPRHSAATCTGPWAFCSSHRRRKRLSVKLGCARS